MKTIDDFKALIPTLVELLSKEDHRIGQSYPEWDESGYCKILDYAGNCFTYEEDGWHIEIDYECCGDYYEDPGDYDNPPCDDLISAWGLVSEIRAYHCDEETCEDTLFREEDLEEFFAPFDEILKDIA